MTPDQPTPSSPEPDRSLDALMHERDQAQASAKRWRRLYEVEAQQRQKESDEAEQTIQGLRAEVQRLCQFSGSAPILMPSPGKSKGGSSGHSQSQMADLIAERDQLLQALEQEKQSHEKTKQNLISALGDALGAQRRKSLALPSSRAGARAGAIILKDRDGRRSKPD